MSYVGTAFDMPIAWDKYSSVLLKLHKRPGPSGGIKRIAILGLPLLDRGPHPLKIALMECLDRYQDWQIVFLGDAFIDTFRFLRKAPCDGILARIVSPEVARIARSIPCPLVNVSSMVRNPGVNTVRRGDRGIGTMCAQHLLDRGMTRIGIVEISPIPGWAFAESMAGFREAIRNCGKNVDIATHRLDLHRPEKEVMPRFKQWLRSLKRPCALFVTDDRFALSVINACREEQLGVPKDIAVICASGTPETLGSSPMTLTHPMMDAGWLIDVACERLADLMQTPRQPIQTIEIPVPGLVQGESTDTIAIDDPIVSRALDFIGAHFHDGINVPDVIEHLQCSRRSLERRFREHLRVTAHDYIVAQRIRHALKRIKEHPKCKLESIARESGFADIQAFRHAFFSSTGRTPSEWRKEVKCASRG